MKKELPNSTSELSDNSSELKCWFSASEIEKLGKASVARLPASERGARQKMQREGWISRIVHGKGGKGGIKIEYQPPSYVLEVIHTYLNENTNFFEYFKSERATSKHYPVSTTEPLVTGSGKHNGLTLKSHSITDMRVNEYAIVPKNDLLSTTEGHDRVIHSEQIVDHLAFKKEWLQMSLNTNSNCLALISVRDDSMEPTLRSDDLILTDTSSSNIENNSIYVLQIDNELIVKRIQRKVNGTVIVKSDNPVYGEEEMDALAAKSLPVVGKVVWYGRRI